MASSPEDIAGRFRLAATRVAEARKVVPATQAEWGRLLGMSQQTFSNLWSGKSFQRFTGAAALARRLGVPAGWLYFGEGVPPSVIADASAAAGEAEGGRGRTRGG